MKLFIAALALTAASTAAIAESPGAAGPLNQRLAESTHTRAEVRQEYLEARAAGTTVRPGEGGTVPQAFTPERSRADVRMALLDHERPTRMQMRQRQ